VKGSGSGEDAPCVVELAIRTIVVNAEPKAKVYNGFVKFHGKAWPGFIAICTVALTTRLLFLDVNPDKHWAYSMFYYGDSIHYHRFASAILRGESYDNGIPYHPPLFAWALAGLYRIHGIPTSDGYVFKIWLALLNSMTVACCWLWYRRFLPRGWSLAGAGLLAFSFGWLVLSATLNNEVVYALFLVATTALVSMDRQFLSWKTAVLLGLAMGLGSLTRAEHLLLWPVLLWLARDRQKAMPSHAVRWCASVIISLLVILPWSVRNYRNLSAFNAASPALEPLPVVATVSRTGP
jgi:hypothetical protein